MEALAGFGAQNRTGRGRPSRIICTAETWPGGHLLAGRPRYSTVFNAAGGAGSYRRRSPRIETASTSRASIMAPMTTRRAMSTRSMAAVCRTPRRGARWRGRQAGVGGGGRTAARWVPSYMPKPKPRKPDDTKRQQERGPAKRPCRPDPAQAPDALRQQPGHQSTVQARARSTAGRYKTAAAAPVHYQFTFSRYRRIGQGADGPHRTR